MYLEIHAEIVTAEEDLEFNLESRVVMDWFQPHKNQLLKHGRISNSSSIP